MTVGELVAYLRLDDSHFKRGLDQAHGKLNQVGARVGTAFKRGAIVAGAAVAGLVGTALVKGFQRLSSIENATAKLKGLGHSAEDVQLIMDNALASVKGTAFGLDEAAGVAATSVAAGIKPGQQLEKTLRLVADAATIGEMSIGEMGAVFNKVAASNKMQGDVMAQLNDAGIPIQQFLAKSLGVTIDKVYELSKAGTISFPMFAKAMEKGLGGAALASGNTAIGAWKNMMAALSRLGASALSGIFPSIPAMFNKIGEMFDRLEAKYGPILKRFGERVAAGFKEGGIAGALKVVLPEGIANDLISTFNVIKDTTVAIVKVLGGIGKVFISLPGTVQKFAIAAGALALALKTFGLLGSTRGFLGGLLGKGGGAAAELPLQGALGLNTAATEANTLALLGKGGVPVPGGGKTPLPLGTPAGTKPGKFGGLSGILSGLGNLTMGFFGSQAAGNALKGTDADLMVLFDKIDKAADKAKDDVSTAGADIARSMRASGDKAGAGLAAGLARGVGPALQSIQKVRNSAGRPIHMGNLDATQMLNEIDRVTGALGGMRGAARTAGNAAANAIRSRSGGGGSYRGHFMAAGGYVPARAGGTPVVLGEGGEGEHVIPDSKMGRGGTVLNINIANVNGTDRQAAQKLADTAGQIFMDQVRYGT